MTSKKPAATKKPDAKIKTAALIRKAYRAGFSEGVNEGSKRLNCLATSNHYLWKELTKLDEFEPIEGVRVSTKFVEELIVALRRSKRNRYYIAELRRRINNSNQKLEKLLEILDGCKEFK